MFNTKCRIHGSDHPAFLCPEGTMNSEDSEADKGQQGAEECEGCKGTGTLELTTGVFPYGVYFMSARCPRCHGKKAKS